MTGLKLGLGIIMVLLAGMVCADEKNVRLVEAQQFAQGNKVAVIVGVNTYDQESGLRPLKYAAADADALTTVLQKHGYAARTLTNQKATKSYILNAIKQAGETLNPQQGTLVFAFSGHGFAQGGNNYLASYGTVGGNLSESALSMQELEQAVRATKARRAVLFIDACRDNPGLEGSKSIGQPSFIQQQSEGIQVLYATKFGEISWEHDSLKHGVFSYFLQKALNGEAADTQGAISFDNLKSYVQQQVANWTFTNLARTQKPFSMGENYGIFMLAGGGNLQTSSTPAPEPAPVARPEPEPQTEPVPAIVPVSRQAFEPEMVDIPAGRFTMGCVAGRDDVEGGCDDDEKPAHEVSMSAFKLAKTEVTVAQFRAFVEATNYKTTADIQGSCFSLKADGSGDDDVKGNSWRSVGYQQSDDHPVTCVSWNDTQAYMGWLKQTTGKPYRLPTEAEWEYAARGGRAGAYPWGQQSAAGCHYANMADQRAKEEYPRMTIANCNDGFVRASPAANFAANSLGLHDMQGNVWEWVQDWKDNYAAEPLADPKSPGSGAGRVLRGGSWSSGAKNVRSANRGWHTPVERDYNLGFRVAQGQ